MKKVAILCLLLFAGFAHGQDAVPLVLKGQIDIVKVTRFIPVTEDREAVKAFPFTLECPANAIRPTWTVPAGVTWTAKTRTLTVTNAPKGELTISAEWSVIDFVKQTITDQVGSRTFLVGDAVPPPLPPVPPIPPTPEPKPPVPTAGLRVLVVAEATDGTLLLSAKQANELYGQAMAEYSRAKFAKGTDGTPELRRFDRDIDTSKLNQVWKEFFTVWQKDANGIVPWIVISNGTTGFSGPLPESGILELVRRYEK